jgi:hypothetical protein
MEHALVSTPTAMRMVHQTAMLKLVHVVIVGFLFYYLLLIIVIVDFQ